jgi:hypothetical protein
MRRYAFKPTCQHLEHRIALSIGGFNIGPIHVPALGTILNGGQAPPPNVSTFGDPEPPSHPLTENINIQNRAPIRISVTINWQAVGVHPYTIIIPAATASGNGYHIFYIKPPTDRTIYNPVITFSPLGGGTSAPLRLSATSPTHPSFFYKGQTYTFNYYHFSLVTLTNGARAVSIYRD